MAWVLDTNVAIRLRDGEAYIARRIAALDGPILMSVITRIELEGGVVRDPAPTAARRPRLDAILDAFPVLPFDDAAADAYRRIVEAVGYSRRKLLDRMIAAQAVVHHAALVTQNAADFQDIPGLNLEIW